MKRTFALRWLGSQAPICSALEAADASDLQAKTAQLLQESNVKSVRVILAFQDTGLNALDLTPCLRTVDEAATTELKLRDQWKTAENQLCNTWTFVQNMPLEQVIPVLVTRHSKIDVLVDSIICRPSDRCADEFAALSKELRSNFMIALAILEHQPSHCFKDAWRALDASLKSNRDFAAAVFSKSPGVYFFGDVGEQWHGDREMVIRAMKYTPAGSYLLYKKLPLELKQDKSVVLAAVERNGTVLKLAPAKFKQDKDVVLAAVTHNGLALQHAAETLRNSKDVVLAAVRQTKWALESASDELQKDKDVLFSAAADH